MAPTPGPVPGDDLVRPFAVEPLSLRRVLRGLLSALHIGPAPRQEM